MLKSSSMVVARNYNHELEELEALNELKELKELLDNSDIPEHDSCGVGAVVDLSRNSTHETAELALRGLEDMEARGGSVGDTGDGAGVMVRTHGLRQFLERHLPSTKSAVPASEEIYSGLFFFRKEEGLNISDSQERINQILCGRGLAALGWRAVPIDENAVGARARETMPIIWQLIFAQGQQTPSTIGEALHTAELLIEREITGAYPVSMEAGTMVWKAMSTSEQLSRFFLDLKDPDFKTDAALWHRRFSTNALARWILAQLFSLLGQNGEVCSIRALREAVRDLKRYLRISPKILLRGGSDSSDYNSTAKLFHSRGVPLDETLRRLTQPSADDIARMPKDLRNYFEATRRCLGPLSATEGPSGTVAMDQKQVVAVLDGMGLRPMRVIETNSGLAIIASEVGAPKLPIKDIRSVYQLGAGEMVVVEHGKVFYPGKAEQKMLRETGFNYQRVARANLVLLPSCTEEPKGGNEKLERKELFRLLNLVGFDRSRMEIIKEMAKTQSEPVKGGGNDQPLAVFSKNRPPLARYLRQTTTDVTNPPLDPLREGSAFDLKTFLGSRPKAHEHAFKYGTRRQVKLENPILTEGQMQFLYSTRSRLKSKIPPVHRFDTTFPKTFNVSNLRERIEEIKKEAVSMAKSRKFSILVFSDRKMQKSEKDGTPLYIPPLIIVSAVHQALIENGLRRNVSLVVDSGEVLDGHDNAVLVGNGADAVCPWLLYESARSGLVEGVSGEEAEKNVERTLVKNMKKVMAKMGVTSLEGFRGARLFEAVAIHPEVTAYYLGGLPSRVGGIKLSDILDDLKERSEEGGEAIRPNRDEGSYNKRVTESLTASGKPGSDREVFLKFLEAVKRTDPVYLRDMLRFKTEGVQPIPLEEVMDWKDIIKDRVRGAAMSHGALNKSEHRAIAAAFNELGGRSNSGEGGEGPDRNPGGKFEADRSRTRQMASGRFAVDAPYVAYAEEIEIKISQGAKPREGGHLPRYRATAEIACIRHTKEGQEIISPPPHHDLYCLEDLALLIENIRAVNPKVKIAVKVASSVDCGVVGVGIAKAGAETACISGAEGGTAASPKSSTENAGLPLEIGIADVHQMLLRNGLRDTVAIRADGGIKTSEDFVKLVLMGADEVALGTALLVAGAECMFCKGCSKFCPKKVCSPDSDEAKYEERKHQTMHFLEMFASHTREILASLGFKSIQEARGRVDKLEQLIRGDRCDRVDLSYLLKDMKDFKVSSIAGDTKEKVERTVSRPAVNAVNQEICDAAASSAKKFKRKLTIHDRSLGATLAGKLSTGEIKLPEGGIEIETEDVAGQGFGFCMVDGMTIRHTGFANDMVCGSMSGGKMVLRLPEHLQDDPDNSIIGNSCVYGATGGKIYAGGRAGQRLGVRNSGALIVAEGAGKYAFEYQTAGVGVLLNLDRCWEMCAGMTGGKVFAFDENKDLKKRVNDEGVYFAPLDSENELELKGILEDFAKETGSKKAISILKDWNKAKRKFKVILPKEK